MSVITSLKLTDFLLTPSNSLRIKKLPKLVPVKRFLLTVTACSSNRSAIVGPVYTLAELNAEKRQTLLNYVNTTYPHEQHLLAPDQEEIPPLVVRAMTDAVTGLVGNLPAPFFDVRIRAGSQSFSELLLSVMMSGYMLRNLEVTTQLQNQFTGADVVGSQDPDNLSSDYAPGTQLRDIQGHVVKWHYEKGTEYISAESYIKSLEQQVQQLQNEVQELRSRSTSGNLLDAFKQLEREKIESLTQDMSEEVQDAMNCFIQRLLGTRDDMIDVQQETSAGDMSKLLFWVMAVGYGLRRLEHQYDLKLQMLETSSSKLLLGSLDFDNE